MLRRIRVSGVWRYGGLLLLLGACAATPAPRRACHPIRIDASVICAEMALTDEALRQGLMGRRSLGADEAMLFVYAAPRRLRFWMKDTYLPLDIGYFDAAGVLREIHPLEPLDKTPVPSAGDRLRFALETPRGWYARNGLAPGARLDLADVDAALQACGVDVSVQP